MGCKRANMSKLVLYSRLGLVLSLVLMAVYYAYRREIRPDMTFGIRLVLHLALVALSAAVIISPVVSYRATQIYSAVITNQQQARAENEPLRNKIFRMPRIGLLILALGLLVTGTVWAVIVDESFVSNAPGWLSGSGAVLCAMVMLGV